MIKKEHILQKGIVVVLSAPSGCGKTTVANELLKQFPSLSVSVSATTRAIRGDEKDGVDYYFLDKDTFKKKIKANEFFEWAKVFGNYYGTLKSSVDVTEFGNDCLLNIDVQGAKQVRRELENAVFIFLLPPSLLVLKERLKNRATDSDVVIDRRLNAAIAELKEVCNYDYVVVNDALDKAVSEVKGIIKSEKLKVSRNKGVINDICTD